MPFSRTMTPIKPTKTERTHEENQERAYIAASRRSDRSLEARVESARRASEIHKRRTGRSLRVTEQDVINEEMYEEEDDDLPTQYRRLTAHLHTADNDFNRRLQAYLMRHVESRRLVGQAIANANGQQYNPDTTNNFMTPNMMHTQGAAFQPSPMLAQQPQQQQQQQQQTQPQMFNRQTQQGSYRQTPYPPGNNTQQNSKPQFHGRSFSLASPHELTARHAQNKSGNAPKPSPVNSTSGEERRPSLPVNSVRSQTPSQHGNISPALSRTGSSNALATQQSVTPQPQQQQQQQQMPSDPFSLTLPMESQQLLSGGPWADMNDPTLNNMMAPPRTRTGYTYNPNAKRVTTPSHDSTPSPTNGLNQTLLPNTLDTNVPGTGTGTGNTPATDTPQSATTDYATSAFPDNGFGGYSFNSFDLGFDPLTGKNDQGGSGQVTPGMNDDWMSWVDGDMFGPATQSAA